MLQIQVTCGENKYSSCRKIKVCTKVGGVKQDTQADLVQRMLSINYKDQSDPG